MNAHELSDKIFACFLGSALGNTMGSIVENWDYKKIEKTYGEIKEPILLDRLKTEDDYRTAQFFVDAYLHYRRPITPEDLAEIWKERMDPEGGFFWCMRNALELFFRGISPRQTGMYNVNTGSALMAIAPVGLFNIGEPDRAYADALDLAYMYQPKMDAQCAAAMAAGYSVALIPGSTKEDVLKAILDHSLDEEIGHFDKKRKIKNIHEAVEVAMEIAEKHPNDWRGAREEIYERLLQWHPIDPMEVLSISVALFGIVGPNYTEAVIAGTNIGRDSDTIANLIGGLAATMQGSASIPEEWKEAVEEMSPDLYKYFNERARSFAELIIDKLTKYSRLAQLIRNS